MIEGLLLLTFAAAWYGLTRASRQWPWVGVALGVAFAAIAVLGAWMVLNAPQSEGSPAGAIAFALGAVVVVVAAGLAIWFGMLGVHGLVSKGRREVSPDDEMPSAFTDHETPFAAIVVLGIATLIVASLLWKAFGNKPHDVVDTEAALAAAGREPPARGHASVAGRNRYDECVGNMSEPQWWDRLGRCADELLAGWDASAAAKKRFANMPDGARFAGFIGQMYVVHAHHTGDYAAARAGLAAVRKRVEQRFPDDRETLSRLDDLEAEVRAAAPSPRLR